MKNQSKWNKSIKYGVNLFILGLVIYVSFQAWDAYDGKFEKQYDFNPPQLSDDFFMGGIEPNANLDFTVSMDHRILLRTTSLSAQNPIDVEVSVYPSTKFIENIPNQWETMPSYVSVVFSNAVLYDKNTKTVGEDLAIIKLERQSEPKQYFGKGTLMYQFEGESGYFFMLPSQMDKLTENGIMYLSNKYIEERLQKSPPIYIGGSDQTVAIKQNNTFLALTLVFVVFAIIESRTHIVSGLVWAFGKEEPEDDTKNNKNKK